MLLIRLVNMWMSTLNWRCAFHAPGVDPTLRDFGGPAIYVLWHEYIPVPLYLRPNCQFAVLLSQHQDAELLSQAAHFAGLETVRGSSYRGGTAALKSLLEKGSGLNLAITPDGPRGPRRKLAAGCIYLSSRLQIPLICMGAGYDRPWRYRRAWDHFAIPKPFSRARVVTSPRLQIPPDLERDDIEAHRVWVENTLNQLCDTADDWACGKIQLEGEKPLARGPRYL
jgi:lysophospholipid acyltransferase (LPLAT)-like uncharacterized protein